MKRSILYRRARPGAALSVLEVGRQTVRSMIADRILNVFAAVLVESGHGTLETPPSGRLPLAAPCLFWLVPGLVHTYGPEAGTAWDERWILFSGPAANEFLTADLIVPGTPLLPLREGGEAARLFVEMHAAAARDSAYGDALAAGIVPYLVTRTALDARLTAPGSAEGDAELVAALREEAMRPVDFNRFARRFGISTATLRRRFVAATGVPPKVFQLRLRIDRAKELLATTDLPIARIASEVGFEDSFYFARLFQQRENATPTEFRARAYRR